jgi:hypothetical protein
MFSRLFKTTFLGWLTASMVSAIIPTGVEVVRISYNGCPSNTTASLSEDRTTFTVTYDRRGTNNSVVSWEPQIANTEPSYLNCEIALEMKYDTHSYSVSVASHEWKGSVRAEYGVRAVISARQVWDGSTAEVCCTLLLSL